MSLHESYIHTRAFARIDGGKLGLFWICSFALFVFNFSYPLCGMLWVITLIATPFLIGIMTRRYAVNQLKGKISYRRAYFYTFLLTFYAGLILAIVQWVYFQYLDHGTLIDKYTSLISSKDVNDALKNMGYKMEDIHDMIGMFKSLRPIDIALQILWSNMFAGLIISLTTALYASSRKMLK